MLSTFMPVVLKHEQHFFFFDELPDDYMTFISSFTTIIASVKRE